MSLIKIPRNIFQTWSTKEMSNELTDLTNTWKEMNPNYAYFLFDDKDCEFFIQNNFENNVYQTYCRIIPGAFKADLWRYCVLYIYGGVYVDIDTICFNRIDDFLDDKIEFMTPIDLNNCPYYGKYNLFNCFVASVPKHPILLDCIKRVVYNVNNNIVPFSNLDFSGPGILGKAANVFIGNDENESFVDKEGDYGTIKFLKFEYGTEYVKDAFRNCILFQNKNGNKTIQNIYENEIKLTNNVNWGTCNNPIRAIGENVTIVSMFYNVREKERNCSNSSLNHSVNYYTNLAKEFILKLPYNLIIFTDDSNVINIINEERTQYKEKTFIVNKPFEETYYYRHLNVLSELQTKFIIHNGNIEHETPMYIILNNNKFFFMEKTPLNINPFNSSHFIMDGFWY